MVLLVIEGGCLLLTDTSQGTRMPWPPCTPLRAGLLRPSKPPTSEFSPAFYWAPGVDRTARCHHWMSRGQQGHSAPKGSREEPLLTFCLLQVVARNAWHPLANGSIAPVSAFTFNGGVPFTCVSVSLWISVLIRTPAIDVLNPVWPHPNLMTSAKSLFPGEVTCVDTRIRTSPYCFGDPAHPRITTSGHWVMSKQEASFKCGSLAGDPSVPDSALTPSTSVQLTCSTGSTEGHGPVSHRQDRPTWSRWFLSKVRAWRTHHLTIIQELWSAWTLSPQLTSS